MSLLREIMDDTQGIVTELLGHDCVLTNTATGATTPVSAVIHSEVELYQSGQFAGVVSTAVFDRATTEPKIGNRLEDLRTGISYVLESVRVETPSKIEFVIGER